MYMLSKQEREFREQMRGKYPGVPRWYAIMTHCGREYDVRERVLLDFAHDGVREVLLPELTAVAKAGSRKKNTGELLFPSYVFLRAEMNDEIYMTVSAYNHVYSILGRAYRIPSVVDDGEMAHFKGVLSSYPLPTVSPCLNIGAEAVVSQGLMGGMRGRVVEFNASFVKIETHFSFFDNGRSIIVSVPSADVQVDETGVCTVPRRDLA